MAYVSTKKYEETAPTKKRFFQIVANIKMCAYYMLLTESARLLWRHAKRDAARFIVFLLLTQAGVTLATEKPYIFIPIGDQEQPLAVQIEYLDDPDGTYTIEQVRERTGSFKPFDTSTHSFEYVKKVLWIRFSVDLSKYQEPYWFLEQNFEHVSDLQLFVPSATGMKVVQWSEETTVRNRIFNTRSPIFKVPTPIVSPAVYYMRFSPQGHWLSVDLSWASTKGMIENIHDTQFVFGLFFGSLFVIWFYNFVLYLYLRDRSYFYYLYYLASFIGYFFYRNGFAPLVVQLTPFQERLFTACAFAAVHGMVLFARQFLTLKISIRWMDAYLRFSQWILFCAGVAVFFLPLGRPIQIISWLILSVIPFLLISGGIRWYQGYEPARLYVAGWVIFGFALFLNALRQLGVIPTNLLTMYLIQIGAVVEAIFFALALAYRIKLIDKATTAAKNAFLAMISHELHTPLQSIVSSIDLLSARGAEKGKNGEVWHRLHVATEHLEMQMKDLTDYALLGSGKMRLHKTSFNASKIIREIVEELRPMAQQKGLNYETEIENSNLVVNSDALRIQQIVNNLVVNAIKYTEVGYVRIRFYHIEEKPQWLVIRVEDSGVGIDTKKTKKMFEPFTQADETSIRKHGGIGMGLAIVQQLLTLLHGTITIDSALEKGTNLEVRIPVEKVRDTKTEIAKFDERNTKRILLVDDTEDVRISLKEIVEQLDYCCDVAASGHAAIHQTKVHQYAVILLDVSMPDMDGFSVAKEIRSSERNGHVPIVWISATAPQLSMPEQRKLFTHFLEKPVRRERLNAMLKKILS